MALEKNENNPNNLIFAQPEVSDELLINPMMGFETYQRFNGDDTEKDNFWDDDGPTQYTEFSGKLSNDDFPDTSVAYLRWYWERLEPEKGAYRWDIIDRALEQAEKRGQELHIRVMPHDATGIVPEWYKKEGKIIEFDMKNGKKSCVPDYSDPLFQASTEKLISLLGERYNNNPTMCTVDIGTLGFWGEWHNCLLSREPLMDEKGRQWAVDLYFKAFPDKPLIMLIGPQDALGYACSKGAGWRADCWGDMQTVWPSKSIPGEGEGPGWNHMKSRYPKNLFASGSGEAWKNGPVCLECCWTYVHWHKMGWDIDYIHEEALRWHVSLINAKNSVIPKEWQDKVDEFQKKMGYRFVLREVTYKADVKCGESFNFTHWWVNEGVAPCYQNYRIIVRLKGPGGEISSELEHDMKKIIPGEDFCPVDEIKIPADLKEGEYEVQFGIVKPGEDKPCVKMANKNRNDGDWLTVGTVNIK